MWKVCRYRSLVDSRIEIGCWSNHWNKIFYSIYLKSKLFFCWTWLSQIVIGRNIGRYPTPFKFQNSTPFSRFKFQIFDWLFFTPILLNFNILISVHPKFLSKFLNFLFFQIKFLVSLLNGILQNCTFRNSKFYFNSKSNFTTIVTETKT